MLSIPLLPSENYTCSIFAIWFLWKPILRPSCHCSSLLACMKTSNADLNMLLVYLYALAFFSFFFLNDTLVIHLMVYIYCNKLPITFVLCVFQAIPPITRMALTRGTWVTVLCRKLRDWWHWVSTLFFIFSLKFLYRDCGRILYFQLQSPI